VTLGSSSHVKRATELARQYISVFGQMMLLVLD